MPSWLCMQALLSNAFAWMRKASEDSLDGMVALLQKVLQLYAAKALSDSGAGALTTVVLASILTVKTQSRHPSPKLASTGCIERLDAPSVCKTVCALVTLHALAPHCPSRREKLCVGYQHLLHRGTSSNS